MTWLIFYAANINCKPVFLTLQGWWNELKSCILATWTPLGLESLYKQLILIAIDNISYCMHFKRCSFIRSQRFQGLKCSWFIFENCIFKNQLRQPRTQFLVVLKEYELCENLNCWENQDQTTTETRKPKNKGTPVPPFPNASITTKW